MCSGQLNGISTSSFVVNVMCKWIAKNAFRSQQQQHHGKMHEIKTRPNATNSLLKVGSTSYLLCTVHTSRHTDFVYFFFSIFSKYFFRLHFNPFKFILLLQSQVASTTLNKLGVGLCAAAAAPPAPTEWHKKATKKKIKIEEHDKNTYYTENLWQIIFVFFFFFSQPVFNAPYRTRW